MKWEFAICPKDEEDLPSGHKRMKKGDIIAVKPYPWEWGKEEVKRFLIVVIDGLTKQQVEDMCSPHYANDKLISELEPDSDEKPIAKRRFKIPLDVLENAAGMTLDINKLEDKSVEYQPLKKINKVLDFTKDNFVYDKEVKSFDKTKLIEASTLK